MSRPGKRHPGRAQRQDKSKQDKSKQDNSKQENSKREAGDLRPLCRALQFWRVCGKAPCRRALDCRGDAQACFRQFWWQLPEEARVWFRAAIAASARGLKNKAAGLAADAEVMRWQELQRRYAPKATPDVGPVQPSPPARPCDPRPEPSPGPRIRSL